MAIAVGSVVRLWHLLNARHLLQMRFLQCNKSQRTPCMLLTPKSIVETHIIVYICFLSNILHPDTPKLVSASAVGKAQEDPGLTAFNYVS